MARRPRRRLDRCQRCGYAAHNRGVSAFGHAAAQSAYGPRRLRPTVRRLFWRAIRHLARGRHETAYEKAQTVFAKDSECQQTFVEIAKFAKRISREMVIDLDL